MKAIIFFIVCSVVILPLYQVQRGDVFDIDGVEEVYFVKIQNGKQCYEKQENKTFSIEDLSNNEGVILTVNKGLDCVIKDFDIKIIKAENIDGLNVLYGYTNIYSDFIYVYGKQSNVQLVESQNKIIVGFPLILSGF